MIIPDLLLIILLVVVSASFVVMVCVVSRARNKRQLLSVAHGASCDGLGCIGITVLGSDVCDPEQVENLMTVEYARYEVVLVIDSHLRRVEFETLLNRYKMISVDFTPSAELPAGEVRGLYRSRKRSFRRLVIIDRVQRDSVHDLNTAAAVASYDYLLPVCCKQYLQPEAVERLVVEVEEHLVGTLDELWVCVGEPAVLLHREAVGRAGGFGGIPGRGIFRKNAKWLWEPVFRTVRQSCKCMRACRAAGAMLLTVAIGGAFWYGCVRGLAVLLTMALVWCCVYYIAQLLEGEGREPVCLFGCRRAACCKKLL